MKGFFVTSHIFVNEEEINNDILKEKDIENELINLKAQIELSQQTIYNIIKKYEDAKLLQDKTSKYYYLKMANEPTQENIEQFNTQNKYNCELTKKFEELFKQINELGTCDIEGFTKNKYIQDKFSIKKVC